MLQNLASERCAVATELEAAAGLAEVKLLDGPTALRSAAVLMRVTALASLPNGTVPSDDFFLKFGELLGAVARVQTMLAAPNPETLRDVRTLLDKLG